jgi:hypothetical protein
VSIVTTALKGKNARVALYPHVKLSDRAVAYLRIVDGRNEQLAFPIKKNKNKLRGPYSASEIYRLIDSHLSAKFWVNFCG